MAEENTANTNVVPFPNANPPWAGDIKEHARLIMAYRETVHLQKVIGQSLKACEDSSDKVDACLHALPAKAKARIALRSAIKKAFGQEEQTACETLEQEHVYLDRKQKLQLAAIDKLETRVLSAHPAAMNDSQRLLRFISAISALKRKGKKSAQPRAKEACTLVKAKPATVLEMPVVDRAIL